VQPWHVWVVMMYPLGAWMHTAFREDHSYVFPAAALDSNKVAEAAACAPSTVSPQPPVSVSFVLSVHFTSQSHAPFSPGTAHSVLTSHNKPVTTTLYSPGGGGITAHRVLTSHNQPCVLQAPQQQQQQQQQQQKKSDHTLRRQTSTDKPAPRADGKSGAAGRAGGGGAVRR
jgi:hypothetical protein